ncbi:hypothetical protein [Methanocalculus alkaliphilus]|uniref:hypothetical protein n=1 Tax=Methanocalculus alkaliphilus TaxID=768730 RepID=UPI002646EBCF|nr:hypothetical protein [Methanocalculus alkaliphilus]
MIYVADLIIFIVDARAYCGYELETQELLLEEMRGLAKVSASSLPTGWIWHGMKGF